MLNVVLTVHTFDTQLLQCTASKAQIFYFWSKGSVKYGLIPLGKVCGLGAALGKSLGS
jgi:hypothetical protein